MRDPDATFGACEIVVAFGRREDLEAIVAAAGWIKPEVITDEPRRNLERAAVEEMREIIPAAFVVHPFGKAVARAVAVRVRIAPRVIDADDQYLGRAYMAPEIFEGGP